MRVIPRCVLRLGALACAAILCSCWQGGGGSPTNPPAPKAAGEIDTSFGEGGIRRISYANYASDARIDAQGRILLASYSTFSIEPGTTYFTRVLPDGNWDQSLAKVVPMAFESVQSDARVFPVGAGGFVALSVATPVSGNTAVMAQKFDDAGNADPSFSTAGSAVLSVAGYADAIGAPDGSVVVFGSAGMVLFDPEFDPVVLRLDARGQRDTAFETNANGVLAGCGRAAGDYKAGRRADGRIVVVLQLESVASGHWCVAQLNPDGTADPTFGTSGRALLNTQAGLLSGPLAVLPLPAGAVAIVVNSVLGVVGATTTTNIFWLTASGQPDASRGGLRSYDRPAFPIGATDAATVQSDGKLLLMGLPYGPGNPYLVPDATKPLLARLDMQGDLDTAFGPEKNGFVTLDAGGNRLSPGRAIASSSGAVYPSGSAAPSGASSDAGYLAVSVMKVYTGEP